MNIPFGVITTIIKRNRDQVKSKSPGSPQGITNYCYSNTVGNLFWIIYIFYSIQNTISGESYI